MDAIAAVSPPSSAASSVTFDSRPAEFSAAREHGSERKALDPAVSLDLSPQAAEKSRDAATKRGFERDADTKTLVFRITDALSGDVVMQIPDEVVLKARAYARQPNAPVGERVERTA